MLTAAEMRKAMAIARDSPLLQSILARSDAHELVIRNYAFGWDGTYPEHEVNLKLSYVMRDGKASVLKIEADNGKSKPCYEKIWLPEVAVNELEKECTADYRYQIAGDEE
jgi:hypothetical protein